ncbi:MAG TPA: helix-turn-helix transcriptional regulator [Alloacidobacterium sp.]|nr:helix-turn-helix transcriptional regulator [Alloacidobacterium sp.]
MKEIGARLRAVRQKWGLTLREVEERSAKLAQKWGKDSFRISASWLDRVEREGRGLSFQKFIVLAVIYSISPEQLLTYCPSPATESQSSEYPSGPNTTLLLTKGPLEDHARLWLPDSAAVDPVPDDTTLLSQENHLPKHYRRGVIGQLDKTLDPMIRPGSIVLINTQRRAIAPRSEWTNEFDRPIYFLLSHAGYVCGWCELDKNAEWLTLVPHPLSYATAQRWRYRKEIEVIGRVAAVLLRLDDSSAVA